MKERQRRQTATRMALLCIACAVPGALACISAPTKSPLMEQSENLVDITSAQLRGQVYDFTSRYATVIEGAADRIIAETDDPTVRERALVWKLEAIPQVHRAAFKPDPLFGLIDTAVLCGQLVEFFTRGAGSDLFGDRQHIAVEAVEWLDREVWRLGESVTLSGDPSRTRREVAQFVAEHPIDDLYFLRDSVEPLLVTMQEARSGRGGTGTVIGGINETVDDLSKRLTIYAAHLPDEARWQAQLAALEMMQQPPCRITLNSWNSSPMRTSSSRRASPVRSS